MLRFGQEVVVDDDLLVDIEVEGIAVVANFVVLEAIDFLFKPLGFTGIRRSPEPDVSFFSCFLRVTKALAAWSVDWPTWFALRQPTAVVKPTNAVSKDVAKVLRKLVEIGVSCKFSRSDSIFAKVFISPHKVLRASNSLDVWVISLEISRSVFSCISLWISNKQVKALRRGEVKFGGERAVRMEMVGTILVTFLFSETS